MSNSIRFLNDAARAHYLAHHGAHKDLVLVFAETWPEGVLLTQEGAAIARRSLAGTGAQFGPICPAMAALAGFKEVLTAACVSEALGST
jgi:hypothetical protein